MEAAYAVGIFALKLIWALFALGCTVYAAVLVADELDWLRASKRNVGVFVAAYWPEEQFWQVHRTSETQYYAAKDRKVKRFVKIGGAK